MVITILLCLTTAACTTNYTAPQTQEPQPVPTPWPTYRPLTSEHTIYDEAAPPLNKTSKGPSTRYVNPNGAP